MQTSKYKMNTFFTRNLDEYHPPGPYLKLKCPRVTVEVDEALERAKKNIPGFVLPPEAAQANESEKRRIEYGSDEGEVLEIGPQAFKDFQGGQAWCQVGDTVLFERYAGFVPPNQDEGADFFIRVLDDTKVILVKRGHNNGQ